MEGRKMFVQKEIEISENYREIEAFYDKYMDCLLKGQPCWLYDSKGYRIGQIYELWILGDDDHKYKLMGKCEIWQRDYSV
jgi:hypothetical protein